MNLIARKHLQSSNYIPAIKKSADIMTPESTLPRVLGSPMTKRRGGKLSYHAEKCQNMLGKKVNHLRLSMWLLLQNVVNVKCYFAASFSNKQFLFKLTITVSISVLGLWGTAWNTRLKLIIIIFQHYSQYCSLIFFLSILFWLDFWNCVLTIFSKCISTIIFDIPTLFLTFQLYSWHFNFLLKVH